MLNMHTQSVNVKRTDLLAALKSNLESHLSEYREARADYQAKVFAELGAALERAKYGDFSKVVVNIAAPVSHEQDFIEVIEMMELSVDDTIQLDRDAFKAYFKNEWPWKKAFESMAASYKFGGALG